MENDNFPKTLQKAIQYFSNPDNCIEFLIALRWPDGIVKCPRCDSDKVTYLAKSRVWKCYGKHDRAKFSIKVGSLMEDSPIGLDKWLAAIWLIANAKNGISSYEIHRAIGVTQKSAWFLLHRIRRAMQEGSFAKLVGSVEVDETFIGGLARNMHANKRPKLSRNGIVGKVAVMGLLERQGKVRTVVLDGLTQEHLQPNVHKHVEQGSNVFSDAHGGYTGLESAYVHNVINHAVEYVRGNVHTNGIENFWSLLKRTLKGTYVSVEPFHLFRYLDEQAFRFNTRKGTDADRFVKAAAALTGKRLTYDQLIGKGGQATSH
jgi:transposase-like protein